MLAPQAAPTFGSSQIANPISGLTSGAQNAAVHNPFGLSTSQVPTWGQRTFGNNPIGQSIDETLAVIDPRASSQALSETRMGMLKDFAKDQMKSGMSGGGGFSQPPGLPNRQVPQQQQSNNATPYTVNSLNRFNRRLNPFGGGL
jgi:hypothetical protein